MQSFILKYEIYIVLLIYLILYYIPHFQFNINLLSQINNFIFLLLNIQYLFTYKKNNIFCFEFLFAISFWLCNFFLPIILQFKGLPYYMKTSENNQFYVILLSNIGYLCYLLGLTYKKKKEQTNFKKIIISKRFNNFFVLLSLISTILFFVYGGWKFIYSYNAQIDTGLESRFGDFGISMSYMIIFLNISTMTSILSIPIKFRYSFLFIFKNINKIFLINLLFIVIFFLIGGYRSGALQLLIPLFVLLFSLKRLSTVTMSIGIGIATFIFVIIGFTRQNVGSSNSKIDDIDLMAASRDFHTANFSNLFLYDYVEQNGCTKGSNAINQIIAPIPYAQSLLHLFIDEKNFKPTSSNIFSDYGNVNYGLGTNVIGDLYYTFGFGGVILFMWLLGYIINKTSSSKNIYLITTYLILCGNAIFAPRVEYFYILRSIGFSILFIFIIKHFISLRLNSNKINYN